MFKTTFGNNQMTSDQRWSRYPNNYFPSDAAWIDNDGFFWPMGRVDDLIDTPSARISTKDLEGALVDHSAVAEAAAFGNYRGTGGHSITTLVTLKDSTQASIALGEELKDHVERKIGPVARPDEIIFAPQLPKTISGKIMRRLVRDMVDGRSLGDTTSLLDNGVVETLENQIRQEVGQKSKS